MSGCAEYCLRVVGLLWAVLGVPGAPSGRVWPVGSGGVASRGCIHTSKIVSRKVHPSLLATAAVREDIDASEIELLTVVCDDVIECLIMEE